MTAVSTIKNTLIQEPSITDSIARKQDGGYISSLFVKGNKFTQYKCSLCSEVCYNAVELSCYQCNDDTIDDDTTYCEPCLKVYLNLNNFTCLQNKQHKNVSYKICQYIRDKVNNSIIYCPTSNRIKEMNACQSVLRMETKVNNIDEKQQQSEQCLWTGKITELVTHLKNECKYYEKQNRCNYSHYGCIFTGVSKVLKQHNKEKMSVHMDLLCNEICSNKVEINNLKLENRKLWNAINEIKEMNIYLQSENEKLWNVINKQSSVSPSPGAVSAPMLEPHPVLTKEMLENASPVERKRLIGERVFSKISVVEPMLVGKIGEMLFELDNTELLVLLSDQRALMNKLNEILAVIQHQQ
eukprot:131823_1